MKRNIALLVALVLVLLSGNSRRVQAQGFWTGLAGGYILGSNNDGPNAGNRPAGFNGEMVYSIDPTRIKDILRVRVGSAVFDTGSDDPAMSYKGRSIWEMFNGLTKGHGKEYAMVRVMVMQSGQNAHHSLLQFLYTEWDNVKPPTPAKQ